MKQIFFPREQRPWHQPLVYSISKLYEDNCKSSALHSGQTFPRLVSRSTGEELFKYLVYRIANFFFFTGGYSPASHADILNTQTQYIEIYINHLAYSINTDSRSLNPSGRRNDDGINLGFERLECLWLSVENIKSWLKSFCEIPCSKLVGQPFHFWSQMILSITLLKYLSTLKDPEWDCQVVRNTVNLISAIDSMLQRIELGSKGPEIQCNDHLLKYLSKLLSRCRMWAEPRWHITTQVQDVEARGSRSVNPDANSHNYQVPDLDQMIWMQSMDLGNEQWFEDVLGMPAIVY